MQYLETISRTKSASWYRMCGDYQGEVQRWVVSTPQTVEICNRPELCGVEFSSALSRGMTAALATAPFADFLRTQPSNQLCIMNFLRGSLNFDLRNAVSNALGSGYHATCFMSSQRFRKDGRWYVKEDMYRKLKIPDGAVLLVGDVVATGVTVDNGLDVIMETLAQHKTSIKALVFFTIGCHTLEKILEEHHRQFTEMFPGYEQTHVVYLEGKFRLVTPETRVVIGIPGTDLIRLDSLLAPEFESSQFDTVSGPLERCTIYDAGSRAFDVGEYLDDVTRYWEQVQRLARRGYTLFEALLERWPAKEYASRKRFDKAKAQQWKGVPKEFTDELWQKHRKRWKGEFKKWAQTREALECVCEDRLGILQELARQIGRER